MRLLLLLGVWFWVTPVQAVIPFGGSGPEDETKVPSLNAHIVGKSRIQFVKIFQAAMEADKFSYGEFVATYMPQFAGAPYGASRESCSASKTLINFETFDCVTFVETFWALAYTVHQYKSGKEKDSDPFRPFVRNVERIRYFGGLNCGIQDRIHYWTQGMVQMQKQGYLVNIAVANGKPFTKKINYLSKLNSRSYTQEYLKRTQSLEKMLTETPRYYYPRNDIETYYLPLAKDGDILSFVADEDGLDVTHTGIVTVKDGELKLTHASSLYNKLVLEQDLMAYLAVKRQCPGIFIYRPVFN